MTPAAAQALAHIAHASTIDRAHHWANEALRHGATATEVLDALSDWDEMHEPTRIGEPS